MKIPKLNIRFSIPRTWQLVMALVCCIGLWSFAGIKQQNRICKALLVQIKNQNENRFLSEQAVRQVANLADGVGSGLELRPWHEIDLDNVERMVAQQDYVAKAQAWKDHEGYLHLDVWQMEPIARLMMPGNRQRYLDIEGNNYPLCPEYAARVLVVDGAGVDALVTKLTQQGELIDKKASAKEVDANAQALFELVRYIHNDQFLKALIGQMTVGSYGEVTLYPQVGDQTIIFGEPTDIEGKFRKLMAFYKQIVAARTWSRYHTVNLKYANQIVCE